MNVAKQSQDAAVPDDNARIVTETVERLGGLDVIVANAGWTKFSDFADIRALSTEDWNKVFTPPRNKALLLVTSLVLVGECYEPSATSSSSTADLQQQQRRGSLYNYLIHCGLSRSHARVSLSFICLPSGRVSLQMEAVWPIR